MKFKRDIMNWPSRGVIATHDYGCPPNTKEGLQRLTEAIARREQALLDARIRKGLNLDGATLPQGAVDEYIRPVQQCDGGPEPGTDDVPEPSTALGSNKS